MSDTTFLLVVIRGFLLCVQLHEAFCQHTLFKEEKVLGRLRRRNSQPATMDAPLSVPTHLGIRIFSLHNVNAFIYIMHVASTMLIVQQLHLPLCAN